MSRISDLAGFTTALSTTQDLSVGVITATSFSGDGSGLTGVASTDNIQTATEATFLSGVKITGVTTASGGVVGNLTGNVTGNATGLSGTPNITVGAVNASSGTISGNLSIGGTLTYQDVTNIDSVGIITAQQGIQVLANGFDVTGFSTFKTGVSVTGVVTATSFSGDVTGNLTGDVNAATFDTGVGGVVVTGVVTATSLDASIAAWTLGADGSNHYTFTGPGDLSSDTDPELQLIRGQKYIFKNRSGGHPFRIQSDPNGSTGTQYNDGVTNNDAGNGTDLIFDVPFDAPSILYYQCTSHGSMGGPIYIGSSSGDEVKLSGGVAFDNLLRESAKITAGKLSDNTNIDLENGMVHLFTTTETTTSTPNLRYNSSTTLNSKMAIGEVISVTLITTAAAAGYSAQLTIDGNAVTENWTGGSAPSVGGSSGVDIYAYAIIKTADATFTVIGTLTTTS